MTMEIKRTLKIKDEDEARDFGLELDDAQKAGQVIHSAATWGPERRLSLKYIARGLEVTETVNSPTLL